MHVTTPLVMLGRQSAAQFMRRHWQKKPLLVRQAFPGLQPPVSRAELFKQASMEDVESRLVVRANDTWRLRHGPFSRRSLPPLSRPAWTLLVQGLDLHVPAAHDLLRRFRFVPDARLDDVMVSYASDGGGVGPHLDAYDVFLIQVQGRRHWRIGRVQDDRLVEGVPLKILQHFEPEQEWVLEPGDMLYLPPRWGHDGVAVGGDCMTCSVGFRSSSVAELAGELLARAADVGDLEEGPFRTRVGRRYRDPGQPATAAAGRVPQALQRFAHEAVQAVLAQPGRLDAVLGEWLTEPKPQVWFRPGGMLRVGQGVNLDARTRMMYDDRHVFLNGESFRASGPDARWMRQLADHRALGPREVAALSAQARELVEDAVQAGWMHAHPPLRGAP
ncbi:MAG: cupin domain-containing protein [Betaproteobacteria bacterium]